MRHLLRLVRGLVLAGCLLGMSLSLLACGGAGLSMTCSEYLQQSEAIQLKLASEWIAVDRGKANQLSNAVAGPTRERLTAYCQDGAHSGQKLKNLQPSLGFSG